jgi:proline iminopeptidase
MSSILRVKEVASEPATNKSRRCGAILARLARLQYAVTGPNPLVIALHGGPGIGCRYLEPEVTEALAGVAEIAFYDQRGSGLSTGVESPALLNMNQFVADLELVRIGLGCERPVLIGHSFGGLLALQYAAAYPGRVAGLVLLDPDPASRSLWSGYMPRVQARQDQRSIKEIAAIQSNAAWACDRALIARYFELYLGPYFASGAAPPGFGLRFTEVIPANLTTTSAAVRSSLGDWDIRRSLGMIPCPCLIVVGEDSFFPQESTDCLKAALANSKVVTLAKASHFPQVESPDEFRDALREFLDPVIAPP